MNALQHIWISEPPRAMSCAFRNESWTSPIMCRPLHIVSAYSGNWISSIRSITNFMRNPDRVRPLSHVEWPRLHDPVRVILGLGACFPVPIVDAYSRRGAAFGVHPIMGTRVPGSPRIAFGHGFSMSLSC